MATVAVVAAFSKASFFTRAALLVAAGYVDRKLASAIFPTDPIKGNRLNDMGILAGEEGAPTTLIQGERCRVPGRIPWAGEREEKKHEEDVGGCGGGTEVTTYEYFRDFAVGICDNALERVNLVLANGKTLYKHPAVTTFSSTLISALVTYKTEPILNLDLFPRLWDPEPARVDGAVTAGDDTFSLEILETYDNIVPIQVGQLFVVDGDAQVYRVDTLSETAPLVYDVGFTPKAQENWADLTPVTVTADRAKITFLQLVSASGGPDLTFLKAGYGVEVSGFAETTNNGTWKCWNTGPYTGGATTAKLVHTGLPEVEAAGNTIAIAQGEDQGVPRFNPNRVKDVTIYLGSESQLPDPLMEAKLGVGEVPGYRGYSYVVLKKVALKHFGNGVPNFEVDATEKTGRTVGEVISFFMTRAERRGADPIEHDASACTAVCGGYWISGVQRLSDALARMVLAYDLVVYDDEGVLTFVPRSSLVARTIPEASLGAFTGERPPADPVDEDDPDDRRLPSSVTVTFCDPDRRHQDGSLTERLPWYSHGSEESLDLQTVTMTGEQARHAGRRVLYTAHANRRRELVTLPPSQLLTRETELLRFQAFDDELTVLTTAVSRGTNWLLEIEGMLEEQDSLVFTDVDDEGGTGPGGDDVDLPALVGLVVVDVGPLTVSDAQVPGYYLLVASSDPTAPWEGAAVYSSLDDVVLTHILDKPIEGTMGAVVSSDVDVDLNTYVWDDRSTINVALDSGTLSSVTRLEVLRGANIAFIGGRVVGFTTATLEADGTYTISGLLWGLLDTRRAVTQPLLAGADFALLTSEAGDVIGVDIVMPDPSYLGVTSYLRGVPVGQDVDDYESEQHTLLGNTVRPFAPNHVRGMRDSSGNLTISWRRRTRAPHGFFDFTPAPLLESEERYEVDVLDAEFGDVVRTIETTSESAAYSSAEQTTDFGGVQWSGLWVRVYQIGDGYGRGNAARRAI